MLLKDFLKFIEDNKDKIDMENTVISYVKSVDIYGERISFDLRYETDEDMVYGFHSLADDLESYLANKREKLAEALRDNL